jgi:hypothetical protein
MLQSFLTDGFEPEAFLVLVLRAFAGRLGEASVSSCLTGAATTRRPKPKCGLFVLGGINSKHNVCLKWLRSKLSSNFWQPSQTCVPNPSPSPPPVPALGSRDALPFRTRPMHRPRRPNNKDRILYPCALETHILRCLHVRRSMCVPRAGIKDSSFLVRTP